MTHALRTLAVLAMLGASGRADAKVTYRGDVPNGYVFDCGTCHEDEVPDLNWFGVDLALANGSEPGVDWQAAWWIDSDGDGLTNGQELGDPCGQWAETGEPELTEAADLSNPGDADSITGDPPDADCGDTGGPDASGQPEEDAGGCLYSTLARSRTPGGLALLAVGLAIIAGRRRSRR